MIKSKEEILQALKAKMGEDTSDETISLIEDITDTINDYDTKTKDSTDWKERYEQNDNEWRKKYRDRFFEAPAQDDVPKDDIDLESKQLTYENLFKE